MPAGQSGIGAHISIGGNSTGNIAVGKDIRQSQVEAGQATVLPEDLAEIQRLFAGLRQEVAAAAPEQHQRAAVERLDELEEAVTAENPDLTTMAYVKSWFSKNLPKVADAVGRVLVSPVVTRVVAAAGDVAAAEVRHQLLGM